MSYIVYWTLVRRGHILAEGPKEFPCVFLFMCVYCILCIFLLYISNCVLSVLRIVWCVFYIVNIMYYDLGTKRTHPGGRAERIFMCCTLPPPPPPSPTPSLPWKRWRQSLGILKSSKTSCSLSYHLVFILSSGHLVSFAVRIYSFSNSLQTFPGMKRIFHTIYHHHQSTLFKLLNL